MTLVSEYSAISSQQSVISYQEARRLAD